MAEKPTVGGIPVECLTGEPAVIWSGWRTLGDRELVREASAKGTHISLAYKCLAYRKNWPISAAIDYFNKEVEIWITELLKKHQIYRASHILKNVGQTPIEYLYEVCMKCTDSALRNYLSEYLISVAHFENEHIESWNIIKSVTEYEQKNMIEGGLSSSLCIEDVMKLPDNVKEALCTELYFSVNNQSIFKNVINTVLWDYLLSNNDMRMVKFWIDIQYHGSPLEECKELNEQHKSLFSQMQITSDMLDCIDSSNASTFSKDLIKNHLCRYGIIVTKEQQTAKLMLARIFGSAITLEQFDAILSYKSCNVNKTAFLQNVDKELCLAHCLRESDSEDGANKVSHLYTVLKNMSECQGQYEDALIEGILETVHYISDDVNEYLRQNNMIVLSLVFLHLSQTESMPDNQNEDAVAKKNTLRDIFTNETGLQLGVHNISNEILQNTLKQIPILENIVENKPKSEEITMYDLLDGYENLNVKQLFKWRFKNEPMPTFSSENLVKKYGHTDALTYEYYLKDSRPTMAIHCLKHTQGKIAGSVSSRMKFKAALHAHVLALRHLDNPEIMCTCISFIEMLGIDSENLRLHITAANYVREELNMSIGNLLEDVIYKNENDLTTVMSYLENSFRKNLKNKHLIEDSEQFVNALKTWETLTRFAIAHNSPLPDSLLKFLANQNDWFDFVLVCQIFDYPVNQVLENVKQFEDTIIREHLSSCLNNPQLSKLDLVPHGDHRVKFQDVRQSASYKTGVQQNVSPTCGSPTSLTDTSSNDSYVTTCDYTPANDGTCSPDDDIWLIILKCHQSPDPPGALIKASRMTARPILTVLATCYEPSSTAAYCYSWMVISAEDEDISSDYNECLEHQIWSANKVLNLLNQMASCGYNSTLSRAYKIFMPESCLNPFFEFLHQCADCGDFTQCQQNLLDFKSQCLTLKCNKAMDWNCSDTTYLKNLYWIAVVAVMSIITALTYNLKSTHLQIKFLEILTKCNFQLDLPVQVPDFQCLMQVTKILQKTNVSLNFMAFTLSDNVYSFDSEIQRCINDLLVDENYDSALELSIVAGLNPPEIILAQCRYEFKQRAKKNDTLGNEFWNECAMNFEKYNVSGEQAAEFFVEHAEKVVSHKQRYEILKLAFEKLKDIDTEQQTIDTLEMAMWKSCILAGPENIQLSTGNYVFTKLKSELFCGLKKLQIRCTLNDTYETDATETLINKLMDSGRLDVALRISTIFQCKHKDLEILMLCLSLAEGEIGPNDLNIEQRNLLEEPSKSKQQKYSALKNRGLQRLSSSSSLNTIVSNPKSLVETSKSQDESIHKDRMECLSILQKLLEMLTHGNDICLRVVLCYKLAVRLRKSYPIILTLTNPLEFLQEITESNVENKIEILTDIITAYNISSNSTATFLTENITVNIKQATEGGYEDHISVWGYPLNTSFHVIMELCTDVSLLGWQLLKRANKLFQDSSIEKTNASTLKAIVELLIRSHDCFTTSCNMEGIASVLRKCQNLANTLKNFKYWTILVRLVIGVGRFTEMNYVFRILKENDQFECLLGQGLDKVAGLKTALLEFLKRYCPEDKELFTLVALHFRLYHEIALMWENEAKGVIKALITSVTKEYGKQQTATQPEFKLIRTENVQKQLQLAITNYTHATQYYLQDNKLNLANWCSDQSQLVTLQLSLLGKVPYNQQAVCILNLKSDEVEKIFCHVLNFSQTLIVMYAYNHHVDWANLIYHHCILNGETKYLKDFIAVNKLTPGLVEDCARRYRLESSITYKMMDNMKALISELSDVECKYMLASQLGFKNIVETMLNNPMIGAYLKDTVWKKGYNAA